MFPKQEKLDFVMWEISESAAKERKTERTDMKFITWMQFLQLGSNMLTGSQHS